MSAVARWAKENPRSAALSDRARCLLPGGVTHDVRLAAPFPLAVARAEGARKWDIDGHELVCHDEVAGGSDPPFDRPDRGGLPGAIPRWVAVIPADPDTLACELSGGDVAAVILEPTGAAWGTVPLPAGFLAAARRLADQAGTLLVYDEVVSGFRWAPGGVQEITGVHPDLTILGKVLAGGMPGGAVCGRADLMIYLAGPEAGPRRVAHPRTHNAHPPSAGAGGTPPELAPFRATPAA